MISTSYLKKALYTKTISFCINNFVPDRTAPLKKSKSVLEVELAPEGS